MWLLKGTLQLTFELFLLVSSTSYICSPHIVSVFSEADWITHTSYRLLQSRFQPSRASCEEFEDGSCGYIGGECDCRPGG
jgi:hypothetical protein